MKNIIKWIKTVLICIPATIGCDARQVETAIPVVESPITWSDCSNKIGDHPCDFTLLDQNGNAWTLYDNFGKIVVLDLSAAWCYYCQVAATDAQVIQDKYDSDDVIYVTLLLEDFEGNPGSVELSDLWATQFGISAPILAGSRDMLNADPNLGWPLGGWPSFWFIDRELVVRHEMRGYNDASLLSTIDSMLVSDIESSSE